MSEREVPTTPPIWHDPCCFRSPYGCKGLCHLLTYLLSLCVSHESPVTTCASHWVPHGLSHYCVPLTVCLMVCLSLCGSLFFSLRLQIAVWLHKSLSGPGAPVVLDSLEAMLRMDTATGSCSIQNLELLKELLWRHHRGPNRVVPTCSRCVRCTRLAALLSLRSSRCASLVLCSSRCAPLAACTPLAVRFLLCLLCSSRCLASDDA